MTEVQAAATLPHPHRRSRSLGCLPTCDSGELKRSSSRYISLRAVSVRGGTRVCAVRGSVRVQAPGRLALQACNIEQATRVGPRPTSPLSARVCVGRGVYVSRASVAARSSIVRRLEHRFSSSTEGAPRAPVAPPPARQRSPRADMTWPCESVGRACFTAEKCSLTYLAKADGSRLAAGVPSRLKAPSSTSSPRQRPHLVRVRG